MTYRLFNRRGIAPAAIVAIIFLLAVIGISSYVLFGSSTDSTTDLLETEDLTEAEIVRLVGQLMLLPDEAPVLATVEDEVALWQDQPFYKDVRNGDKLLIFPEAAKAVIYRAEEHLLINVGPIFVDEEATVNEQIPDGTTAAE